MKVIILSAGKGSRLKLDTPKSLIKIDDNKDLNLIRKTLTIKIILK